MARASASSRDSARIVFLALTSELQFVPVGGLDADPESPLDDDCVVSCTDWYGNARPIFYQDRIFALLGYELVEGELRNGSLAELGRTSFLGAEN